MHASRTFLAAAATSLFLGSMATPCLAAPSFQEKQEAKTLVADAKKAMKAGSFDDAVTALRRADTLDPSGPTKLDLAAALVESKKLIEATQVLRAVIEAGGTGWNEKKAVDSAKKSLGEIEPRVPWLAVTVEGAAAASATVKVDGEPFDAANESPIDPGAHEVVVEATGYERAKKSVTIAESAHEKVTITLVAVPVVAAPDADAETSGGGSKLPAFIAFGVGGAGLVVGGIFGVMAFSETSDVESQCGATCPPTQSGALSDAKTKGTISTIGFVVGGVGVATGVILLLTSGKGASATAEAGIHPWVGAGEAGVYGSF